MPTDCEIIYKWDPLIKLEISNTTNTDGEVEQQMTPFSCCPNSKGIRPLPFKIECDNNNRITYFELGPYSEVSLNLTKDLLLMEKLEYLDLSHNSLKGNLIDFNKFVHLKTLILASNNFTGVLTDLNKLNTLKYCDIKNLGEVCYNGKLPAVCEASHGHILPCNLGRRKDLTTVGLSHPGYFVGMILTIIFIFLALFLVGFFLASREENKKHLSREKREHVTTMLESRYRRPKISTLESVVTDSPIEKFSMQSQTPGFLHNSNNNAIESEFKSHNGQYATAKITSNYGVEHLNADGKELSPVKHRPQITKQEYQ
ncbi:hypothetical protein HDU92_001895 [Lobulomyces angularis]|nr:hypothetical protein HDU92_001895 [Lobulomyces angularis]